MSQYSYHFEKQCLSQRAPSRDANCLVAVILVSLFIDVPSRFYLWPHFFRNYKPFLEFEHESLVKELQPETFPNSTSLSLASAWWTFYLDVSEKPETKHMGSQTKIFYSCSYSFLIFRSRINVDSFLLPLNIKRLSNSTDATFILASIYCSS